MTPESIPNAFGLCFFGSGWVPSFFTRSTILVRSNFEIIRWIFVRFHIIISENFVMIVLTKLGVSERGTMDF